MASGSPRAPRGEARRLLDDQTGRVVAVLLLIALQPHTRHAERIHRGMIRLPIGLLRNYALGVALSRAYNDQAGVRLA